MPNSALLLRQKIQHGQLEDVRRLIQSRSLNLNYTLFLAIYAAFGSKSVRDAASFNADMTIINELLSAGADPYYKGFCRAPDSPFMLFAMSGLLEARDPLVLSIRSHLLQSKHHYSNYEEAFCCLKQACVRGYNATTELLLLCHPELADTHDPSMQKFYYCRQYHFEKFRDERMVTPLDIAVHFNFASTAQILIAYGFETDSLHTKNVVRVDRESGLEPGDSTFIASYAECPAFEHADQVTRDAVTMMNDPCNRSLNLLLCDRVQNFLVPYMVSLSGPETPTSLAASRNVVEYFRSCDRTSELRGVLCHLANVLNTASACYKPRGWNANLDEVFRDVIEGFPQDGVHKDINDLGASMMKEIAKQRQVARSSGPKNPCAQLCVLM